MVNKQKIILFDIDNTLFSGDVYRDKIFTALAHAANQDDVQSFKTFAAEEYFHMRKTGPFIPSEFTKILVKKLGLSIFPEDLEKVIWDENLMKKSLFEESEEVLHKLSKNGHSILGVFSSGPYELQRAKIRAIENLFHKEHLNIYMFKDEGLKEVMDKYQTYEVFLVDDLLEILYNATLIRKNIYTIWIKRGWIAREQKPIEGFNPSKVITDLREILPIFE